MGRSLRAQINGNHERAAEFDEKWQHLQKIVSTLCSNICAIIFFLISALCLSPPKIIEMATLYSATAKYHVRVHYRL